MDIMTEENILTFKVANMELTYLSFCSDSRRVGDGVNGVDLGYLYLSKLQVTLH